MPESESIDSPAVRGASPQDQESRPASDQANSDLAYVAVAG